MDVEALTAEALTMQMLRSRGLPVPEVYTFEPSTLNALGCPFIMMEYIVGTPLYGGKPRYRLTELNDSS